MESVVFDGNGGSGALVVTELSHIKELVRQLEGHLGGSQSRDLCRHLASQISSVTERSISLVTSFHLDAARKRKPPSPLSDACCDAPFKTTKKTMEKKRHQVRVRSAGAGAGGGGDIPAVDDGHSWRKYGQKEILGAKHPRSYYRCTHRHSQGCAATKQVQRTDQDQTLFDVVYLGDHTCVHSPPAGQAANLAMKVEALAAVEPDQPQGCGASATAPFCLLSASENCGASPATSDSNHVAPFPAFELAGGDVQFGFEEVMSVFGFDECVDDLDISSFLA